MSKDKRTGWLAELQVGDKVFVKNRYGTRVAKVEKITPTGRVVADRIVFNPNGTQYGSHGYGSFFLLECTKEKYDEFLVAVNKSRIANIIVDTTKDTLMRLPLETLEKFVEEIKNIKGENKND